MKTKTRSIRFRLLCQGFIFFLLGFLLLISVLFFSFRYLTLSSSRINASSAAQIVRDEALAYILKKDSAIETGESVRLKKSDLPNNVREIRVFKEKKLLYRVGSDLSPRTDLSEYEKEAHQSKKILESFREFSLRPEFILVLPFQYVPEKSGDCSNCTEETKSVNGVISIILDLEEQRNLTLSFIALISIISFAFCFFIFGVLYYFFRPYTHFFDNLKAGVEYVEKEQQKSIEEGNTVRKVKRELGRREKILRRLSRSRFVEAFRVGCRKLFIPISRKFAITTHTLHETAKSVDQLIKIYNFKRAIERDKNKRNIYARMREAFLDIEIKNFLIYELDFQKNSFRLVAQDREIEDGGFEQAYNLQVMTSENICYFANRCDLPEMDTIDQCPAQKSGKVIDSMEDPNICSRFQCGDKRKVLHKCVPFMGTTIGNIVQLAFERIDSDKLNEKLSIIQSYLHEASHVLEAQTAMEYIRDQALIDELTGLFNRRYLTGFFRDIKRKFHTEKRKIGFIMVDIDHFKQVNDQCGHDVGDLVLKEVSKIIQESVRTTDTVVRFGGEEILVLADDINTGDTAIIAEKIRVSVEAAVFHYTSGLLKKTVSIGCSEYPHHSSDFQKCIKVADIALYKAKTNGRNQVIMFNPQQNKTVS